MKPNDAANVAARAGTNGLTPAATATGMTIGTTTDADAVLLVVSDTTMAISTAKMVMLNENQKLAPDRAGGKLGTDNDHEYKLYGYFSGDKVYEPASNGIYPEFVLKGYELISTTPPPIFKSQMSGRNPTDLRYVVEKPE